jgi:cytoplasmic tRNA 2-thiolation protein 1
MSSNELCKACTLLEGLERGMASAAVVGRVGCAALFQSSWRHLQTDRARKKLDAQGPAPDSLRTIPFFEYAGKASSSLEPPTPIVVDESS